MIHTPEHFLDNDANAARVMAHARLLLGMTRRLAAVAPPGLQHALRVANYKSGKLVIHAENGAVAVRIRQMSQRLCDELSKSGVQCNDMEVKVQPRQSAYQSSASPPLPLSAAAAAGLAATAAALPDGPLRRALEGLAAQGPR